MTTLKQIGYFSVVVLGIIIIAGTIVCSIMYVPTKTLSVITSTIGSCIGMILIMQAYTKLSVLTVENERQNLAQSKELQEKVHKQAHEINKLQMEKTRLENMRLDVNSITPILKLSLLEMEMEIKDFKKEEILIDERDKSFLNLSIGKSHHEIWHEYLGVMAKKFKAHIGIDLNKVRISSLDKGTIIVSGIQSEFQGKLAEETDWPMYELRKYHKKDNKTKTYEILHDDHKNAAGNALTKFTIEQHKDVEKRINSGIDHDKKLVERIGQQFISLILKPINKEIKFSEIAPSENTFSLIEYIALHNGEVENKISELDATKEKLLLQVNGGQTVLSYDALSSAKN
jgi:hypothetical protein